MSLAIEVAGKLNYLNTQDKNTINALAPNSGYTKVSKKLDNFVFQTSSSFINKVADKNRFIKFGDKVVDTYTHSSYDATKGGVVADFTNTVPDVAEVITNGSNTTSVAVSQGDYVVDGSELVANGTFDTDTSGWTAHSGVTLGVDNSRLSMASSTVAGAYKSLLGLVTGNVYTFKITRTSTNTTRFYISGNGYSSGAIYTSSQISGNGTTEVITFTATASTMYIVLYNTSSGTSYWDNISVKRVSDTFRAKQDVPIGTALTNTTYFEDRTQIGVTNQGLAYHSYNTLTNSYEGIKTEVLFSDVSKGDLLDNPTWMARNGFSKVSQFLYSKGSYLVLPIGIWQSLNKGAYHPFFNPFGTKRQRRTDLSCSAPTSWWSSLAPIATNTSITFTTDCSYVSIISGNGTITSGRDDGKFYDICYPDQFIDVREYAKILNRDEVNLIIADKEENGVEEIVFTLTNKNGNGTNLYYDYGDGRLAMYYPSNYFNSIKIGSMIDISYYDGTARYSDRNLIVTNNINNMLFFTSSIIDSAYGSVGAVAINDIKEFMVTFTKPILSSNTKLANKVISNPTYYSQNMKDRLASGVGIVGLLPDLVDDTGASNLPNGSKTVFKLNGKFTTTHQVLKSTDSGATWSLLALTTHYSINYVTNTITFVTAPASTDLFIVANSSAVLAYIQTTPKPVIDVEPKVIASNSNSLYKGALIGNQVSGKIQVGNGANGYESKVLDNAQITKVTKDGATQNSIIYVNKGDTVVNWTNSTYGTIGNVYEWIENNNSGITISTTRFDLTNLWRNLGTYTQPSHSTIALDNANSPASKYFKALEQGNNGVLAGVYGKELAYNTSTSSFDGDNELFDLLTNSTKTDLNSKTVKCFHGSIPINAEVR